MSLLTDDCLLTDCCLADVQRLLDKQTKALLAKLETKLDLLVAKLEENPPGRDRVRLTDSNQELTTGFKQVITELAKMSDRSNRSDQQDNKLAERQLQLEDKVQYLQDRLEAVET